MVNIDTACAQCGRPIVRRDKKRGQTLYFCSQPCFRLSRRTGREIPCGICGKPIYRKRHNADKRAFCSRACLKAAAPGLMQERAKLGPLRLNWKGGITMRDGYRMVWLPEHPNANKKGYVPEHRLVMANKLGRPLRLDELVHHLNHIKDDNREENLVLVRRVDHSRAHRLERVLGRSGWSLYPDGCSECRTTEIKHQARGQCHRCYTRLKAREYALAKPRSGERNNQNMKRGTESPRSKLTDDAVISIRARYVPRKTSLKSLADEYGVSLHAIHGIVSGRTWKHVR